MSLTVILALLGQAMKLAAELRAIAINNGVTDEQLAAIDADYDERIMSRTQEAQGDSDPG